MTNQSVCPACFRPEHDGLLCNICTKALKLDLEHLTENWSILQEVITRQTKRGNGSGEDPVPFNVAASTTADDVNNTITTWIRELDNGDTASLRPVMRAMVNWLLFRLDRIRRHEAAGEILDELRYACRSVRIAIDLPPELRLVGTCPLCGASLMATLGAQEITCRRCERAGTEAIYDVPTMRQQLADRVHDELVPRALALQVVAKVWGVEIPGSTFRSWIKRERLESKGNTDKGVPLYRVGDVLNLATSSEKEAV